MKIALVVPHFFPEFGGHEYYLSRELGRLGHQVEIFTSDFLPVRYFRRPTRTVSGTENLEQRVSVTRIRAIMDLDGLPIFDPGKFVEDFHPDVVQGTEFYHPSSYFACMISAKIRVPYVFAQHMYEPPGGSRGLIWRALSKTLGSRIRSGSSQIIAISNAAKSLLLSLGVPDWKVNVVPLGVDTTFFHQSEDKLKCKSEMGLSDSTVLLYVGRLEAVKGVSTLLRAFAILRREHPTTVLILVGSGALQNAYRGLASILGISSSVLFPGSVNREELPLYFGSADILVLPSLKEPFGLVGLEAMASGVPVVASAVGGIPDFIGEGSGILVRPGDPLQLAQALQRLVEDSSLRTRMGECGLRQVFSDFSYHRVTERTLQVFDKAAAMVH